MGDTEDGPSSAAQSAQETSSNRQRGFFGRIIDALSPSDSSEVDASETANIERVTAPNELRPGMLNLRRMRLDDVAIPKGDIVSVPVDIKKDDLVEVFRKTGLTRIPVFKGTLDAPIGFVHLKDFALLHGFNGKGSRYNLSKMVRPLLFEPPSMPIGVLLQKMQSDRIHMALVIDEYGGVDGLVTIEDLIEQVIGEIEDEHDATEDQFWTVESPGIYLALAKTPLDEFGAEIGINLEEAVEDDEVDTLGGLVFVLAGRVPARGEMVQHPDGPVFEIVDADLRRVTRIRVRMNPATSDG